MREVGLRPEEVRSVHDMRHLPPVGKAEIRKKLGMFRSLDRQLYVQEVSTSGSENNQLFRRSSGLDVDYAEVKNFTPRVST